MLRRKLRDELGERGSCTGCGRRGAATCRVDYAMR
jgi:hypothetical protein